MAGDTQETKLKKNGIYISPILIGVFIGLGILTVLAVGIISGLVFRKICSDDGNLSNLGQGGTNNNTFSVCMHLCGCPRERKYLLKREKNSDNEKKLFKV
jgi:hypothetical protein